MTMADLQRFKDAQRNDYEQALQEVKSGRKRTHWMWYIFPQIHGLGMTPISDYYSIRSLREAKDYLKDPVLGAGLVVTDFMNCHATAFTGCH